MTLNWPPSGGPPGSWRAPAQLKVTKLKKDFPKKIKNFDKMLDIGSFFWDNRVSPNGDT
jgi:hypothetical protein